jgi:colanic acid/amylovoran biosynthesis glycosyltransferase
MKSRSKVVIVTLAGCGREGSEVWIDRKFHSGVLRFVEGLDADLTVVAPRVARADAQKEIDHLPRAESDLPYRLLLLHTDRHARPDPSDWRQAHDTIGAASLLYGAASDGICARSIETALAARVRLVLIVEHTLEIEQDMNELSEPNRFKRWINHRRIGKAYAQTAARLRLADALHCNGYPAYEACADVNRQRLLYLDSRIERAACIDAGRLADRLRDLAAGRPPRLVFSGRFEPIKGVLDVVRGAIELRRNGVEFDLEMFGRGSLRPSMERLVTDAGCGETIRIHDAVPFPQLVAKVHEKDLFLSGARQGDPSCTYLETFGSGVPIVGFANHTWIAMAAASGAGTVVPGADPKQLAAEIQLLLGNSDRLAELSRNALAFAAGNDAESQLQKRIDGLADALDSRP